VKQALLATHDCLRSHSQAIKELERILPTKCNKSELTAGLSLKATNSDVSRMLEHLQASQTNQVSEVKCRLAGIEQAVQEVRQTGSSQVESKLANQAMQIQTDMLELKQLVEQQISAMNSSLELKANKTSVAQALQRKANRSDIDTLLQEKVDLADFENVVRALEVKADTADCN
jgi:hypothetical protein